MVLIPIKAVLPKTRLLLAVQFASGPRLQSTDSLSTVGHCLTSARGNENDGSNLAARQQTNDYIIVCVGSNAASDLVSVKTGSNTSLSLIQTGGTANVFISVWALFSAGTFSDTIVVTQSAAAFCTVDAFGVSGSGQTSLVWDSGGPQYIGTDPVSITTANASTMVIATFREGAQSTPTAGSGFGQVSGADWFLTEYKVLSSTQTLSCTQTTGAGTSNGCLAVAIVHA